MKKFLLILFLVGPSFAYGQTDSLILSNNDLIVGEIKSMDRGVLTIETDYSDTDFKISWVGISKIFSQTNYLITLSNGKRYNGTLNSLDSLNAEINTYDREGFLHPISKKNDQTEKPEGGKQLITLGEVVYLNALDEGFWSRLSANIDLGWSLTKANTLRQFNVRSGLGYLADRWKASTTYNSLRSTQDEVADVKRTDGSFAFNYFLQRDWFLLYNFTYLSNTEQLIRSRTGNQIGLGKYLIHTNKTYFGFQTGINLNSESYFDDTPSRNSGEAMIGAELNLYDIGDLTLLTNLMTYPSFTEKKRFRTDFKLDVKYDFLDDFYVKLGTTMNFDNQPIEGATKLDYIFQTTVGWEL
jgi:small nuclear ribonucleoprotein (snRNP)-like protein